MLFPQFPAQIQFVVLNSSNQEFSRTRLLAFLGVIFSLTPSCSRDPDYRLFGNFGWKGPWEISSPTPCSKQDRLWGQNRLLRTLSSLVFKSSKDADCIVGNLFYCLTVLMVKTFISSLNLFFQLVRIVSHPSAVYFCEDHGSVFLMTSFMCWKGGAIRFLQSLHQAEGALFPQPLARSSCCTSHL